MPNRDSDAVPDGGVARASAARDARSEYQYVSESVERPDLVRALESRVDGEVRFDTYTRQMYATDASAYEVTPIGVVFPTSTDDVASVVSYCAEEEIPVLPRGGGTSLAGQTVNEAVVLDFTRHMDAVRDVDPDAREARVQAGTVLATLNDRAAEYGLTFGPDPAAGNRSAIGGAIGNNSTGAHSLVYEKTDHYVEEAEVVLADGTVTTFGEVAVDDLRERANPDGDAEARVAAGVVAVLDEHTGEIHERFPEMKRNVSGYNLDRLVAEAEGEYGEEGVVNLARLLAGSEGTLAVVTEATVSLEPLPETKSVALLTYDSVVETVSDIVHVLEHDPAAVELIDDVLIELAANTTEFADVAAKLPERTEAALLVEFYAENDEEGREKVRELLEDRVPGRADADGDDDSGDGDDDGASADADPDRYAFDALEAHEEADRKELWKLRKSGLPILLGRTSDAKHISFLEDCAVPPEHLPRFVTEFQSVLEEHDTFASFYAHAGPGVLHVRPLVNTKSQTDLDAMEAIGEAVTDLVVELGGSVSGEHGDGRARTQWNRKLYGDDLWFAFQDLKTAFDPDWLLNPGQVCGDVALTENLRFDPDYEFDAGFDSALNWENENGMQGMVELCHGCGGCRTQQTEGGVMCPTYRAADEEITATRGRANMLRQAMSGDLPDDPTDERFVTEVMDLCIGCKGCANDCPSEVDLAKLKAEVTHAYHEEHGSSLRSKLFANVDSLAKLGSTFAPVSNWAAKVPGARAVLEKTIGIASDRTLPTFERETLQDWFEARGGCRVAPTEAERQAVLLPDTYTNYSHPAVGKAAVRVLEAAGVYVDVADVTDSGRPAFSKGFLDVARETAAETVDALAPRIEDGWDVVVAEPSDAVMLQSDYGDLLSGPEVESVQANSYGVCEYLDAFRLDEGIDFDVPDRSVAYHGHCHQKATKKDHHAVGVLRRAGYAVDPLDSGCCGMAGSFGYEAEHRAMSRAIGDTLKGQVDASEAESVVAPGASCRTQLNDLGATIDQSLLPEPDADREGPPTPIEALAAGLSGN
ncbi:FAD-binding and (Fe-S)-binding domain-containing protein [Halobellus rufus]|uniref:FAD-binding and (Fe-S)-binding domain-containing protein n=1 Tax=Halobellus rufus TaxID=1448860 RepID=UPI000679B36B|nr:FAD-binding and (Fe-S)-binding domain-containing protein [Halobellus rufus]